MVVGMMAGAIWRERDGRGGGIAGPYATVEEASMVGSLYAEEGDFLVQLYDIGPPTWLCRWERGRWVALPGITVTVRGGAVVAYSFAVMDSRQP